MNPPPHRPLAISACSILTPLDDGTLDTWSALRAGHSVGKRTAVHDHLLDPDTTLDRSIRLALAAVKKLDADLTHTDLFCGTSKGPITTFIAAAENLRHNKPLTEMQAKHIALGVGSMGALLHEKLNLTGTTHTSIAACSSGLHALHRAANAIRQGDSTRALVVAADASLHPLFNASFQRLGVLAPPQPDGTPRCLPFDPDGKGFFLIEAAAAILLENSEFKILNSELRPPPPLAWLDASWIGADSSALIAVDPHTHSLRAGLQRFLPLAPHLAFIHAHATGTAHDAYELAALQDTFGPHVPIFSHKKNLGHSLGAAGLLSIALSTLSHHHHQTSNGSPVPPASHSLTLAQGFGGHIAIVALRSGESQA